MTTLTVFGRRWFDKRAGNTYHSAQIFVDGTLVHTSEMTYGYGDCYLQTAGEWLEKNGYAPDYKFPLSIWCRERGVTYHYSVADVLRMKDL